VSAPLAGAAAVLVDLEGTVYEAGRPVAGAAQALDALARRGIACAFTTNTTSRPRSQLARELSGMGIHADPESLWTAPRAARDYLLARGWRRCHLLIRSSIREDFAGIEDASDSPDAVVVGDIGEEFNFERLNDAFRLLLDGAELVTLSRNRYYRASDGLRLDQGPFVAALEQATGRAAILVGKPAPDFFAPVLKTLGTEAARTAAVGDDLTVDVGGAQALGMRGVLVRTGKFRQEELAHSAVRPDAVIDSLADLPGLF
jgi:phospholysine phosphohistidine inorganic pyrophosphate phosphatase